ncbi:MAG: BACON domain-containing protein [Bacteroides sp.]|nr:BACON domain-containing protein [Bacteroides sp.]
MKKFLTLFSAACVASTALAVEKETAAPQHNVVPPVSATLKASTKLNTRVAFDNGSIALGAKKTMTRAGENGSALYFRPADNAMTFSLPSAGSSGYALGFVSAYGSADFYNYSTGVEDAKWSYSELNDFEVLNSKISWNEKTSTANQLSIKSGVGMFKAPVVTGTVNGIASEYSYPSNMYYAGGFPAYYLGEEEGKNIGLTFYQNTWLEDAEGYQGAAVATYVYAPGMQDFEASGAANVWYTRLESALEGMELTDLELQNFSVIQPKPVSAYLLSKGWLWAAVQASAATQLTSYIYPIDEEGNVAENPIALGYAAIPKGQTTKIVFEYNALNEDGDEVEEDIVIDGEAMFTIEGFNGNPAIQQIVVQCGFYPFSYAAYQTAKNPDYIKVSDLYAGLSFKADGQLVTGTMADTGIYFVGAEDDEDTLSRLSYAQFATDAIFPWILSVNGEESVTLPLTGGEATIDVNALLYNISGGLEEGVYEYSSPEWIEVNFGESSYETGNTPMKVSVKASEASRVGEVVIKGYGVSYSLKVIQGEDTGVSSIAIDNNAEYYDLQGRKVANPDKGIYIKKTGNKSEKVIL